MVPAADKVGLPPGGLGSRSTKLMLSRLQGHCARRGIRGEEIAEVGAIFEWPLPPIPDSGQIRAIA